MKKLFILFAISSLGFVACNNGATEEATEVSTDSTAIEAPVEVNADTMVNLDTTVAVPADSTVVSH